MTVPDRALRWRDMTQAQAAAGIEIGWCDDPNCHDPHLLLVDGEGRVFATAQAPVGLEAALAQVRRDRELADRTKQVARQ